MHRRVTPHLVLRVVSTGVALFVQRMNQVGRLTRPVRNCSGQAGWSVARRQRQYCGI